MYVIETSYFDETMLSSDSFKTEKEALVFYDKKKKEIENGNLNRPVVISLTNNIKLETIRKKQ